MFGQKPVSAEPKKMAEAFRASVRRQVVKEKVIQKFGHLLPRSEEGAGE